MDTAIQFKESEPGVRDSRLLEKYKDTRRLTEELCAPLENEDYVIQSMENVSPTKWHLGHTSWFFEANILAPRYPDYRSLNPDYSYLFNSYYVSLGPRYSRPKRGLLSRPTVTQVYDYRAHVDEHVLALSKKLSAKDFEQIAPVLEMGIHHEQQHQELILTDIKHVFSSNPLRPAYNLDAHPAVGEIVPPPREWVTYPEGVYSIGDDGRGFAYDNERPRHRTLVGSFRLASRLVTNGEYLEFMEDGGYTNPLLWLSDGWDAVTREGWKGPLYWEKRDGRWWNMTLSGMVEMSEPEPVCHVSYYEADAYSRWAGARLPTEAEWEVAAGEVSLRGNFVESGNFHPVPLKRSESGGNPSQMFGDVWEWTQSHYSPYPGFTPVSGALGEYNGKFMANQFVLRGGSCATSGTHIRVTYRNFFPAHARWQFSGIRLAGDPQE